MRRNLSNLQTAVRAAARHESHHHLLACFQLELRSPRRERMEAHAQSGWLCELVVGSDDARENVNLLSFSFTHNNRARQGASRLHSRCTEERATSRAQDRDSRAVETLRYEDRRLPVSRRRTSSGLHSCRCEATNSECLKVDGQRHRKHSSKLASSFCDDLMVRRLNSHVVVVSSFCNVKLLFRCVWHLWMRSQRGSS